MHPSFTGKRLLAPLAAAAGLLSWIACAAPLGARATHGADAAISDPEVRELVRFVNERRAAKGCRPLIWSPRLARVAQAHSRDMAARHFFSHDDPDGASPFDRLAEAGISYLRAGENIAAGHRTGESVFRDWVKSRRHRANLDDCDFTHHGVGFFEGRWTHLLLRPAPGVELERPPSRWGDARGRTTGSRLPGRPLRERGSGPGPQP